MRITNDFSILDKLFAKKAKKDRKGKQEEGDPDESRLAHTA
jgi:hypothetical protein